MTDTPTAPAPAPVADAPVDTVAKFELPHMEGDHTFDCATIPAPVRLDFLKTAVRGYVSNRINSVHNRYEKDEKVVAWAAYDAAMKADPLQSAVPKPEGDRPAAPNYAEARDKAYADLVAGNVRKKSDEAKPRATKDPLISLVTKTVEREVFDSKHAENKAYTYLNARKDVGGDGVAYLKAMIETRVAAGVDRAALEKLLEAKYLQPARNMLGLDVPKAQTGLPSIL